MMIQGTLTHKRVPSLCRSVFQNRFILQRIRSQRIRSYFNSNSKVLPSDNIHSIESNLSTSTTTNPKIHPSVSTNIDFEGETYLSSSQVPALFGFDQSIPRKLQRRLFTCEQISDKASFVGDSESLGSDGNIISSFDIYGVCDTYGVFGNNWIAVDVLKCHEIGEYQIGEFKISETESVPYLVTCVVKSTRKPFSPFPKKSYGGSKRHSNLPQGKVTTTKSGENMKKTESENAENGSFTISSKENGAVTNSSKDAASQSSESKDAADESSMKSSYVPYTQRKRRRRKKEWANCAGWEVGGFMAKSIEKQTAHSAPVLEWKSFVARCTETGERLVVGPGAKTDLKPAKKNTNANKKTDFKPLPYFVNETDGDRYNGYHYNGYYRYDCYGYPIRDENRKSKFIHPLKPLPVQISNGIIFLKFDSILFPHLRSSQRGLERFRRYDPLLSCPGVVQMLFGERASDKRGRALEREDVLLAPLLQRKAKTPEDQEESLEEATKTGRSDAKEKSTTLIIDSFGNKVEVDCFGTPPAPILKKSKRKKPQGTKYVKNKKLKSSSSEIGYDVPDTAPSSSELPTTKRVFNFIERLLVEGTKKGNPSVNQIDLGSCVVDGNWKQTMERLSKGCSFQDETDQVHEQILNPKVSIARSKNRFQILIYPNVLISGMMSSITTSPSMVERVYVIVVKPGHSSYEGHKKPGHEGHKKTILEISRFGLESEDDDFIEGLLHLLRRDSSIVGADSENRSDRSVSLPIHHWHLQLFEDYRSVIRDSSASDQLLNTAYSDYSREEICEEYNHIVMNANSEEYNHAIDSVIQNQVVSP